MAILATDNFQRTPVNPLDGDWTNDTATGWGPLQIISSGVVEAGTGAPEWDDAFYSGIACPNDQKSQVTLLADNGTGVCLRNQGNATQYFCEVRGGNLRVLKTVAGIISPLANFTSGTFTPGDIVVGTIQGTTLTFYYNGTLLGSFTDATLASGSFGITVGVYATLADTQVTDFVGSDFNPPNPTSIAPTSGTQGQTLDVTVSGTEFDADGGATLSFSGSGITVNSYSVQNATTITANITISGSATTGARDVIVTNASDSQTGTLSAAFTVTSPPPPSEHYSQPDCRDYATFPNDAIDINGTETYTVQRFESRSDGAPVDSRADGAPIDCGEYPQNSRAPGTYGPGE